MIRRFAFIAAVLLALAVRVAVPAGYMPVVAGGRVVLAPCPGGVPARTPMAGMTGMAHHTTGEPRDDHAAPQGCAFADLSVPVLDAGAPPLPTIITEPALQQNVGEIAALPLAKRSRWRPPLRAPPTLRHA